MLSGATKRTETIHGQSGILIPCERVPFRSVRRAYGVVRFSCVLFHCLLILSKSLPQQYQQRKAGETKNEPVKIIRGVATVGGIQTE